MAEVVGFEPTVPCGTTVFKTAAFDHSATPPQSFYNSRQAVDECQAVSRADFRLAPASLSRYLGSGKTAVKYARPARGDTMPCPSGRPSL